MERMSQPHTEAVESAAEIIPERFAMTMSFDFIFTEAGAPLIIELNGARSGFSGMQSVAFPTSGSAYEKTKHVIDSVRSVRERNENYREATEGFRPREITEQYVAVKRKAVALMHELLAYYPDKTVPKKLKQDVQETLVEFEGVAQKKLAAVYDSGVHDHIPPIAVNLLVENKSFMRFLVDETNRPREYYEMSQAEKEAVAFWIEKTDDSSGGQGIQITKNTPNTRELYDTLPDGFRGPHYNVIQEFIPTKTADAAAEVDGAASLRYLQDAQYDDGEIVPFYGGGYQRVVNPNNADEYTTDPRIVNKFSGAKSVAMSPAERAAILPMVKKVNHQLAAVITWLREELA